MSLKFFLFPSGAGMWMFVGFLTLQHATYSCPCEKHGSQCCHAIYKTFPRKDETGWERRRRFHVNTGASDTHTHTHTHTRDSQGSQHCVVIPLAKHLAGTTGRLRRRKNVLSLDSIRKEDGRKLDRIFIIICINAMQLQVQFIIHFLPVSSGFSFHTHALHSFLRVFNALCTVHIRDVTPTRDITQ
jgi:hypothetical protein